MSSASMPASARYGVRSASAPFEAYAGIRNACSETMSGGVPAESAELSSTMPGQSSEVVLTWRSGFAALNWLAKICCTAQTSALLGSMVVTSAGYLLAHSLKKRQSSSVSAA